MIISKEQLHSFFNQYRKYISLGLIMSIFFIVSGLLSIEEITFNTISRTILTGLATGFLMSFITEFLVKGIINNRYVVDADFIKYLPEEKLLMQSNANHFKGIEAVGGMLFITNLRVIYKSHKVNFQNHLFEVNIADIVSYEKCKTFGVIENGILLSLTNGTKERFVVDNNHLIISKLNKIKSNIE
jgi:hypothetical protein